VQGLLYSLAFSLGSLLAVVIFLIFSVFQLTVFLSKSVTVFFKKIVTDLTSTEPELQTNMQR
jgi:hypothetical protein